MTADAQAVRSTQLPPCRIGPELFGVQTHASSTLRSRCFAVASCRHVGSEARRQPARFGPGAVYLLS